MVTKKLLLDEPFPEFFCGLCQDILEDPIQVRCPEDHIFCSKCIEKYMQQSSTCPLCMTCLDPSMFQPSKFVQRQIGRLRTRCLYYEAGCTWQGLLSDDHSSHCGFGPCDCPNAERGCKEKILRMNLQQHQSQCPYELVHCPNMMPLCKPMLRKDMPIHEKECRSYPCQYAIEGCPFVGTRPEAEAHCEMYCGKIHRRLKELEAEVDRLKKIVANYEGNHVVTPQTNQSNNISSQPPPPPPQKQQQQSDAMDGLDLLQIFNNDNFMPFGLMNDKTENNSTTATTTTAATASSGSDIMTDLMDIGGCLQPSSTTPRNNGKSPPTNMNLFPSTPTTPITAPKRAPNGKIIRYSKNVRLAHSALRMAREQQQQTAQQQEKSAIEALLDELNASSSPLSKTEKDSNELANLLAEQTLSSPQRNNNNNNSSFRFKNADDVTKFLSDIPSDQPSPVLKMRPRNDNNSNKFTKERKKKQQQQQQQPEAAAAATSHHHNPPTPPSQQSIPAPNTNNNNNNNNSSAPRRRPMFVLASTYLSNYNNNNNSNALQ